MIRRLICLVLTTWLCAWAQEPTAQKTALEQPAVEHMPASNMLAGYRIMAGDVIDIRFFYNPELNEQQVSVRPDGCVSMQLIGDVDLASKTPEQGRRLIEALYSTRLRTPSVSIQIRKYAGNKVYVTGEVPKPGLIELEGPMSVMAAIAQAGGITTKGNRNKVMLIRKMDDGRAAKRAIHLFSHGGTSVAAMASLQPYDVILVPESTVSRLDRWVDQWIRQLSPPNLVVGFQYLAQPQQSIPVF